MTDHEEKIAMAFLEGLASSGGYELRPVAYDTINRVKLLELTLGSGDKEAWMALDEDRRLDEIHAYLFIQSAPLQEGAAVIRAFRTRKRNDGIEDAFEWLMVNHVDPFLSRLSPSAKADLAEQLTSFDAIEAARVVAVPPLAGGRSEPPDPNSESQGGSPRA